VRLTSTLRCFRGINTLSAMVLLAELVDFQRFHRPRAVMAYLAWCPASIPPASVSAAARSARPVTPLPRRVLVEAAWRYRHRPALGGCRLARDTASQAPAILAEAWRAQHRLYRRLRHLLAHGKRPTVAAAALARELAGFVWAAMTKPPALAA